MQPGQEIIQQPQLMNNFQGGRDGPYRRENRAGSRRAFPAPIPQPQARASNSPSIIPAAPADDAAGGAKGRRRHRDCGGDVRCCSATDQTCRRQDRSGW